MNRFKVLFGGVFAVLTAGIASLVAITPANAQPPKVDAPAPSVYGMAKAFESAKTFVPVKDWKGVNTLQREFVRDYIGLGSEVTKLPASMLEAVASSDEKVINNFLQKHGLTIKVPKFGRGDFGAASVLSVEGKWAGKAVKLKDSDKKEYDGVELKAVQFFNIPGNTEPVVRIYNSDEFKVFVASWDGKDEGFNTLKQARDLTPTSSDKPDRKTYNELTMPMIDMDRTTDLEWLKGMTGGGGTITTALAQTKVKLDEHGFSVKEGFVFGVTREPQPAPKVYVLNKPFILWVQIDGLTHPFFAVKVDTKYWNRPPATK